MAFSQTHSVEKRIPPGSSVDCDECGVLVKFIAGKKQTNTQVIANIYEDGQWQRVAHWHKACYTGEVTALGPA